MSQLTITWPRIPKIDTHDAFINSHVKSKLQFSRLNHLLVMSKSIHICQNLRTKTKVLYAYTRSPIEYRMSSYKYPFQAKNRYTSQYYSKTLTNRKLCEPKKTSKFVSCHASLIIYPGIPKIFHLRKILKYFPLSRITKYPEKWKIYS